MLKLTNGMFFGELKAMSFRFILVCFILCADFNNVKSQSADTVLSADTVVINRDNRIDSTAKRKFVFYPPRADTTCKKGCRLRNEETKFGRKLGRGLVFTFGYNSMITGLLLVMPEDVSKWNKANYKNQLKSAYTGPPVIDHDKWYINYLGHPYQGTIYYNALRSQGANVWQSALFCAGSVWLWEYTIEAGFEQPSIQDLIVTPGAGILLGELFHYSTIRMSRNGYTWYEKMVVSILNPTFAINNGFKFAGNNKIKHKF